MQIREGEHRRHYTNRPGSQPTAKPPRLTIPQKVETLNRRIANLEAIDPGVFTGNVLASFLALPGLVGFWPMSSVQRSTGNTYDLSGQGRTLTYNGNPAYSYYNGLVPYISLDGTGDYLSRADETDLDILGNESIYTSGAAGLTMGGWFYPTSVGAGLFGLIGKYASGQISYLLYRSATTAAFTISTNGSALVGSISSSITLAVNTWHFIVGRFTPSTETKIFVNSTSNNNTTSIPATIFNSTTAFEIGRYNLNSSTCFAGYASLCFLCANALGDDLISSLYQQSRILFAV